ncbi:MAG: HAD family hydrolase [Cyanobacteria bacterium J06632_3]
MNDLTPSAAACAQTRSDAKPVVFCDFDGPIVDVSERYYQTYRKGLRALAALYRQQTGTRLVLSPLSKGQFWQMKQSRVADLEIAMRSGIPADWFKPYMQQVEKLVNHPRLLQWDRLQPSAEAALTHLKQANVRLVLVTLRQPCQVDAFLRTQGLNHLVDAVYGASTAAAAHQNRVSQKRELLAEAIAQQQAQGHCTKKSWMVGDTEADVLAAKDMGLPSAALSCGVRSVDYLKALEPTEIYGELLTAAQAVVETTGQCAA